MPTNRWKHIYAEKKVGLDQALGSVRRGAKVLLGTACAEPQYLVQGLLDSADRLHDVQIMHYLALGEAPYTDQRYDSRFRHSAFFVGPGTRSAINNGRADYTPAFVSEIPALFRDKLVPIDVALIQVSPPDAHGFVSLGVSVDIIRAAVDAAKVVVAQVNRHMPRTMGNSFLHITQIDHLVEHDAPLPEFHYPRPDEVGLKIARNAARLINDGDTLHIGFGHIPWAVTEFLGSRRGLGLHTEVISDAIINLVEGGVVTGEKKTIRPGRVVCTFCIGSRQMYDWVDNNPGLAFHPAEYVYSPLIIAQNDNMISIGSALEVDLSGQICSESQGYYFYSGVGGRLDFIRGAAMSRGGRSVVALPSTTPDGQSSRIRPHLQEGAGVVVTRGDVKYVVTEYGIAYLHGKTVRERAMALINIAHPKFRGALLEEAKRRAYVYQDQILVNTGEHAYPEEEEFETELKNGLQISVRPIKPTDEPLLQDFFYSHSDETIYRRYFRAVKAMPHSQAQTLVNLDYHKRMALVATLGEIGMERIIGVGRYGEEHDRPEMVETAYTVHEEYQGLGLGSVLQARLEDYARRRGFKGISAYLFRENAPMLKVYQKGGALSSEYVEGGVLRIWRYFPTEEGEERSEA